MPATPIVVRLCNYIGDVVLGLPALALLAERGRAPQLYGKGWARPLLAAYDWPLTVRAGTWRERVRELSALRRTLGTRDALAMPNSFSSAAELRLAGFAPTGYARDGRGLLLAHRVPDLGEPHMLQQFWRLACAVVGHDGAPPARIDLALSAAAVARAERLIAERGWGDGFVVLAPFAGGLVDKQPKKWPAFAAFARELAREGRPLVLCPGPGAELDEARRDYAGLQIVERLPLDDYAALLARAALVVANDTGPAHVAAAVGAPLLSVLGPTQAAQWAPWGPTVEIVQRWPQWPAVDEVLERARACLGAARSLDDNRAR